MGQDALSKLQSLTDTLNLAVDSLKLLHPAAEHWDAMLIHIAVQKLGIGLQKEWEKTLIGIDDYPTLGAFNSFLQSQIRIQENLERNKGTGSSQETHRFQKAAHNTAVDRSAGSCSYCAQPHKIYKCEEFQALTLAERYNVQREKELCANCLHKGHTRQECQSQVTCRHCSGRHHTLLHYDKAPKQLSKAEKKKSEKSPSPKRKAKSNHLVNTESADESSDEGSTSEEFIEEEEEKEEYFGGHSWQTHKDVLLATALVRVHSPLGKTAVARALIDTGAETSFISEALAQTMRLPKKKVQVTVTGLQGTKTGAIRHATSLQFSAVQDGSRRFDLQAYVLQHITNYKPKRFSPERYEELQHLILADPQPASKLKIDILLGSDVLGQIMKGGFLKLQGSKVTAQATHLGWILSGPVREVTVSHAITVSHAACETDALLKKFWEIEDFPEKKLLSEEDEMCEKYFSTTTTRDAQGRYCVRLPFKSETAKDELGESKSIAIASWARVARGLQKTPKLRQEYDEFISEYEKLGHMREMKPDDPELSSCVFLTHHPIIRPDHLTTQLRVVYNASRATKSGVSLNDVLCAGPKLQNDVADVVTNWRRHQFVLKADISKMFRQILIHEDDQKYQCIVYSDSVTDDYKYFKMLTVTYGTRPAPYLANRVIKQVVEDHGADFPLAVQPLQKCIYVDDAFLGADTKEEAKEQRKQVDSLLKNGCLELRKWSANSDELLPDIEPNSAEFFIEPTGEDKKTVLGIAWSPQEDSFSIKVKVTDREIITKRTILSDTASLFDPLGWLAPFVIRAKIVMQALWLAKVNWDETQLPAEILADWQAIWEEIPKLSAVSIPRCIGPGRANTVIQLLGFSDASKTAYAAAVYLKVSYQTGEVKCNLIQAKTRVAPIKTVSIPRLELCGAVLLAKLIKHLQETWLGQIDSSICYTDSRIVLDWLAKHASHWHTFVANRVSFIQSTIPEIPWRHLPGAMNPADLPSRGLSAASLVNSQLWWHGPDLTKIKEIKQSEEEHKAMEIEVEREACHLITAHETVVKKLPEYLIRRSSTWPKLTRVIAYCLKYIDILGMRVARRDGENCAQHELLPTYQRQALLQVEKVPWKQQTVSLQQIERAETHIHKVQQETAFELEIETLRNEKPVSKGSYLLQLRPFLDEKGLLRVGGRLQYSTLSWHQRHPIILPKDPVTNLIIKHYHINGLHGALQPTLSRLRELYWIVHGRGLVKSIINRCVRCLRYTTQGQTQLMAPLPMERCSESSPFTHVGVDYCGYFWMKHGNGRGYKAHKVWVVVFVCFSTRSVHLEIVDGYASTHFLAAFKCFVSRRGLPSSLWVDRGTNLQGACAELQRVFRALTSSAEWLNHLTMQKIEFHSIPPKGPHHGGIWEAAVKAFKHHFYRVLGNFTPSWLEMHTLVCQIEACLNSRPIIPIHDDINGETGLTAGHFLMGKSLKSLPERKVLDKKESLLNRWQTVSLIVQRFWKIWRTGYIHEFYPRHKWREQQEDLKIGDIVIMLDNDLPPCDWGLAIIIDTKPGRDNLVREVTDRTEKSTLERPITKLCKLPIDLPES